MTNSKTIRLSQAARELNLSHARLVEFLRSKGFNDVESSPNAKITQDQYDLLRKEFAASAAVAQEARELNLNTSRNTNIIIDTENSNEKTASSEEEGEARVNAPKSEPVRKPAEEPKKAVEEVKKEEVITAGRSMQVPKVVGKIELDSKNRPVRPKPVETPKQEEPVAVKKEEPKANPPKVEEPKVVATKEEPKKEEPKKEAPIKAEAADEDEPELVISFDDEDSDDGYDDSDDHSDDGYDDSDDDEVVVKEEEEDDIEEIERKKRLLQYEKELQQEEEVVLPIVRKSKVKKPEPVVKPIIAVDEDVVELIEAKAEKLQGLKVVGRIDLPAERKKGAKPLSAKEKELAKAKESKKKRKRVKKQKGSPIQQDETQRNALNTTVKKKEGPAAPSTNNASAGSGNNGNNKKKKRKDEVVEQEVDQQLKKTLAKMSTSARGTKSSKSKFKREKRQAHEEQRELEALQAQEDAGILRVAEFISTSELATLMDVEVNEVIMKSIKMGMFISINQRLDAEAITVLADEFGFDVDFTSAEEEVDVAIEDEDTEDDLKTRAPIVTIMGHVDHGKTSLLDHIRKTKVVEGEAGGITQHIGAYSVMTSSGRRIVFLDTPGHEAFTAMRARGAKVTDVVIIVIAADDSVMPQTVEAINHAQVAGVPFVIAFNKVDKPTANVNRIKEQLANMNILVDSWGGKVQSQEISAKTGQGVEELLDLVLLESDILELKANPDKNAIGTVIEASLDKGRGYVATILVQAGTLRVGDVILAGTHFGRVKAMNDHRGAKMDTAPPSTPVQVLGLNGAPQAGDKFNVLDSEREARDIAGKRAQIMREQSIRATKRPTLGDLARRIALGNFHQLNVIIKGDVDGSIQALSDSLQKLSTEEVQVNILHKAVGAISESDILLATASDAIVIGFQVRPVPSAKRLAEQESVEVRMYSIIYEAINDVKSAMEGLLSPTIEENIIGNIEVRDVFKITKVGTVAGCFVTDGYMKRSSKIRVIRDGIVVYGGESGGDIQALKRFKDDVSEVRQGFECGLSIRNFNDIRVGDIIEAFEQKEIKRKL